MARLLQREKHIQAGPQLVCLHEARSAGSLIFLDNSIENCRLAQLLDVGPGSFVASGLYSREILKAAADGLPLKDLAAPVAALIQRQRVSNPCILVGYCFGGFLAFEVAHQLHQNGVRVDMVVLLDSWRRPRSWSWSQRLKLISPGHAYQSASWHLRHLWRGATPLVLRRFGFSESRDALERDDQPRWMEVPNEIQTRIVRSVRKCYQWEPLESRGVLVRARDDRFSPLYDTDGSLGWSGLFKGGLETLDAPGDHWSLLAHDHIPGLAQALRQHLSRLVENAT